MKYGCKMPQKVSRFSAANGCQSPFGGRCPFSGNLCARGAAPEPCFGLIFREVGGCAYLTRVLPPPEVGTPAADLAGGDFLPYNISSGPLQWYVSVHRRGKFLTKLLLHDTMQIGTLFGTIRGGFATTSGRRCVYAHHVTYRTVHCYDHRETQKPPLGQVTVSVSK